jgi:hypothetical protein
MTALAGLDAVAVFVAAVFFAAGVAVGANWRASGRPRRLALPGERRRRLGRAA